MQTSYGVNYTKGVEGMAQACRRSRPLTLPSLEQITLLTVDAGSETADLVTTIVDDETGESWSYTATGSATEATLLANALAAFAAHDALPMLFDLSGEVDTDVLLTHAARHADRTYTISATGGTAVAAPVASEVQAPGGDGVGFGRFVAFGGDGEFASLAAATPKGDVAGVLFRTDANHFRLTDGDAAATSDLAERGRTYSIMEEGRFLAQVEGTVARGDSVYVRRATTAGAGSVGRVRAAAAGGQQSYTFTPSAVNLPGYGFEFDYAGVHYTALYLGDGTTTVAQAADGLVQDLGTISGLTITDGATLVTIQTAAGTELENVRNLASHTDVPVDSVTIAETVSEDLDTLDISDFASFEEDGTDGQLVWVKVSMGAQ